MPFSDFLLRNKLRAQGVNPISGAAGPSSPDDPNQPGLLSLFGGPAAQGLNSFLTPERQQLLGIAGSLLGNSGGSGNSIPPGLLGLLLKNR